MCASQREQSPSPQPDDRIVRVAEPGGAFGDPRAPAEYRSASGDHVQDPLVAVCCSSASVSSRLRACTSSNSRTFSMAITAWSAKVSASSICLRVNGRGALAQHEQHADERHPPRISGTPRMARTPNFRATRRR